MRSRNFIVIAVAVVLGLFAVFLANSYFSGMEKRNERIAEDMNLVPVVTARVALNYGDPLTPETLRIVQWPAASVPVGAFKDIRQLTANPQGARVALRPIEAGVPILAQMLTGPGGRAVISATLAVDKRAVAIRVNDVSGVAGFILPGDSVDVLLTRQPLNSDGRDEQITDTIVENVRVIAADQNANDASKDPQVSKTVTLEVDPEQGQKLALAGQIGQLSLALRNAANRDAAEARTVGIADLSPGGAYVAPSRPTYTYAPVRRASAPAPSRPAAPSMLVGKGLQVSSVEVSRDAGN